MWAAIDYQMNSDFLDDAEAHSLAKHQILQGYLKGWLPILVPVRRTASSIVTAEWSRCRHEAIRPTGRCSGPTARRIKRTVLARNAAAVRRQRAAHSRVLHRTGYFRTFVLFLETATGPTSGRLARAGGLGWVHTEIVLTNGHRLRLRGPVDQAALASVLSVLAGR
jgi:hypothetical protein